MPTIKQLIDQLCPDGVEYKKLGEFADVYTGNQLNKSNMSVKGLYPVINGGIEASGYIEDFNENENTITISQGGASAGYVNWITTRFWLGAHCYAIKPIENINNRYLYFILKNIERKIMASKHGAGIPGLNRKVLFALSIPVPPLVIQERIVEVLDKFTALEAELEARRKQYAYYREKLLSFPQLPPPNQRN